MTDRTLVKSALPFAAAILVILFFSCSRPHDRLQVFVYSIENSAAAGNKDSFLSQWKTLLAERNAKVDGGTRFPNKGELARTDVLVVYGEGGAISPANQANISSFLKRGGGIVLVGDAIRGADGSWLKGTVGATPPPVAKPISGVMGLYFPSPRHPITEGVSNFDIDDQLSPSWELIAGAQVIANSFRSTNEVTPQIWAYESKKHRAMVCLPGHHASTFDLPYFRALLLRGIAWAGRRNTDLLTTKLELAHLRFPGGGPTPPEEAAKKMKVQPQFEVSLVASEPLIFRPVHIDWDAKRRLWAAISPSFPFQTNSDIVRTNAILVLEDTNGDGRMDKRQVFLESTNPITSFVFHRDGVIVCQPPEILWARDTDGDGVADKHELIFTGFERSDPRAAINNLHWGRDGWIYCDQGAGNPEPEKISNKEGKVFGKIGNGIFRFKPDGSAIEMVSAFTGNSRGFDFTWDDELFFSKGEGPHVSHVMMPERFLARGKVGKATSDKNIEDHKKVYPLIAEQPHEFVPLPLVSEFKAASGGMVYEGGTWPMRYQNTYFVCDPLLHIVHEDILTPLVEGAIGYEATRAQPGEFIAGTDPWFRPIGTHYGPDGAVYLLDAYGFSKNEGAISSRFEHELHGRIWRIQNKYARTLPIPELADAPSPNLVKALTHPNEWVRSTAQRLLVERAETNVTKSLTSLVLSNRVPYVRVDALWTLHRLHSLNQTNLIHSINDPHPSVQKNALRVVSERGLTLSTNLEKAVTKQVKDVDDRVKLAALCALQQGGLGKESRHDVLRHFAEQKDVWAKSAYLGIGLSFPMEFLKGDLMTDKPESFKEMISLVADHLAQTGNVSNAVYLVERIARDGKKTTPNLLQGAIFDSFTRAESPDFVPKWTPELEKAFKTLLASDSSAVRYNSMALAQRWDTDKVLTRQMADATEQLADDLEKKDLKDDQRNRIITVVMSIPSIHAQVIPVLGTVFGTNMSAAVLNHMVKEFGRSADPSVARVLIDRFRILNAEGKQLALSTLLRRQEWSTQLVDALAAKKLRLTDLSIFALNRLINYPDAELARRAIEVIQSIRGPIQGDKELLVAGFRPALAKTPDLKNGSEMFKNNCGICHKFGEKDKDREKAKELGPELAGIGVYGASALLAHILDPNRIVETNMVAFNITTKKGENLYGIIISEAKESLKFRNFEGETEIRVADITAKESTHKSFMPEGMEALGEKNVADIVGYVVDKAPKAYRTIDLMSVCTADSRKTLFSEPAGTPSLEFKKFGLTTIDHVPFNIADPNASTRSNNLIVLRGGSGFARTLPQKAEVPVGMRASKIHVLGGVAGWGYSSARSLNTNEVLVRAKIVYSDGKSEDFVFKNGYEFADYLKRIDVPGSRYVPDLLAEGQIRVFSFNPKRTNEVISRIVLESVDGPAAPAFVAMTAQVADK